MARFWACLAAGTPVNSIVEHTRPSQYCGASRGVSLVEAMVALAVMAFGMLALVGVQTTLRMNNDLAKQRSEATLIATEEVERLRNYFTLLPVNGQPGISWAEILEQPAADYLPPGAIGNTTYRVTRSVITDDVTRQKTFKVEVSWLDRTGVSQHVVIDGIVWGVVPQLSTLLAIPTRPSATNQINGRNVTIPANVVDVDGGNFSRFVPPGSNGVAWMFDRTTGALRACAADGTSNCRLARFISGEVRFHRPAAAGVITAADAEIPQGPSLNLAAGPNAMTLEIPPDVNGVTSECYSDVYTAAQLTDAALPRVTAIKYYCAILSGATLGWGGMLKPQLVNPTDSTAVTPGSLASDVKVCRYTIASTAFTNNEDHPKTYCAVTPTTLTINLSCNLTRVTGNLINQNFLVIPGDRACPTDTAINLATGDLLNTNTLQHQP